MTKKLISSTIFFLLGIAICHAQSTGDFQTRNNSGNWSDFNTWNIYNGVAWVAASSGQIPTSTSDIFIQAGHTITVDNTTAVCNNLNVNGASTSKIALNANAVINIKGDFSIFSTSSNPISSWGIAAKIVFSGTGNQTLNNSSAFVTFVNLEINKNSGTFSFPGSNLNFTAIVLTAGTVAVGIGAELRGTSSSASVTINGGSWTQISSTTRLNGGGPGIGIPLVVSAGSMILATSNGGAGGFNFSSIEVKNGGTLTLNYFTGNISTSLSINVDATSTLNVALENLTLPASVTFNGVVNYNRTGAQTIPAANYSYLKISGTGVKTLGAGTTTIPANGFLEMSGIAPSPTLATGGNTLSVSSSNSTLIYSSASTQTATANEWNADFYNVTINNPAGVSMTGLNGSVNGALTLTAGALNIGAAGSLTLNGASLVSVAGVLGGTNTSDLVVTGTTGGIVTLPQAGNISLRNVTIGGTRTVVMNGLHHINLSGAFLVESTATFDTGGESQILQNTGGTVTIDGKFITRDADGFSGTNAAIPGITPTLNTGCTIEYGRLGNQLVNARSDYKNISFSGSGSKTLSSECDPAGTVYITGSAILEILNHSFGDANTSLTMDGGRFRLAGTDTKPDMQGTYNLTGGVIEFFGGTSATNQTIRGSASIFYQAIEINSAFVANSNANINLSAGGSFTIKSGAVFTINDESITGLSGNQTVTIESGAKFVCGDADGFSGGSGIASTSIRSDVENINLNPGSTIEYARTTDQFFSARSDYKNVIISGAGEKTLNGPSTISGILTLTNGLLKTTSTNLLTLNTTASCPAGGNATSFVSGPMKKIGNTAFVFPIGKPVLAGPAGGGFRFMSISAPAQITDAFTAEFIVGSATALGPIGAFASGLGLTRVSRCEYWILDRTPASTSAVDVTLSWNARSNCNVSYVSDLSTLAIAHFNSIDGEWDEFGGVGNTVVGSTTTAGSITWPAVTNFSPFSLASTDFLENLLPLHLSGFNARARSIDVELSWQLTNNLDQNEFILERSKDAIHYKVFKSVPVKMNQEQAIYTEYDREPIAGWNYYRLRSIDKMGKTGISNIVKVWFGVKETVRISPNPASEKIVLNLSHPSSIFQIDLVNISGQVLRTVTNIQFSTEINISQMQAGIYYLRILGKNGLVVKSFVKN